MTSYQNTPINFIAPPCAIFVKTVAKIKIVEDLIFVKSLCIVPHFHVGRHVGKTIHELLQRGNVSEVISHSNVDSVSPINGGGELYLSRKVIALFEQLN